MVEFLTAQTSGLGLRDCVGSLLEACVACAGEDSANTARKKDAAADLRIVAKAGSDGQPESQRVVISCSGTRP